jgi:hypothetical protein
MRKAIAMLALGGTLAAAGAVQARFSEGVYRGVTEREKPVSFRASDRQVRGFKIRVRYGCTDFDRFWTTEDGFPAIRIGRGRFEGRFRTSDGTYEATIRGTLEGRRAKGSYVAERTYDRDGNLDPRGRVTCSVTKTAWTAKRR